jgi:hypothetical protein
MGGEKGRREAAQSLFSLPLDRGEWGRRRYRMETLLARAASAMD